MRLIMVRANCPEHGEIEVTMRDVTLRKETYRVDCPHGHAFEKPTSPDITRMLRDGGVLEESAIERLRQAS